MLGWRLSGDNVESDTLWRFYGDFMDGENIVNLITIMVNMEIVWRQCGE